LKIVTNPSNKVFLSFLVVNHIMGGNMVAKSDALEKDPVDNSIHEGNVEPPWTQDEEKAALQK
jgi:hypothetical protein